MPRPTSRTESTRLHPAYWEIAIFVTAVDSREPVPIKCHFGFSIPAHSRISGVRPQACCTRILVQRARRQPSGDAEEYFYGDTGNPAGHMVQPWGECDTKGHS